MKDQIFFVISLGVTGFLPKTCSSDSVLPANLIAYPPKGFFFAFLFELLFDFLLLLVFDFLLFFVANIEIVKRFYYKNLQVKSNITHRDFSTKFYSFV